MTKPVIAWSYSTLNTAENCLRKFWALKIGKVVADDSSADNEAGKEDHRAIQHYFKSRLKLPPHLVGLQPVFDKLRAAPGEQYVEYKMTLKQDFTVTGWKDYENAWVRGAGDYIKVNGPLATYMDWKRGKVRDDVEDQVDLTALLVFAHFPAVQRVQAGMFFYRFNHIEPHAVDRADAPRLWNNYISRVRVLEDAIKTGNFPANPNPLCGWCPYKACPHNTVDQRLAREAAKAAQR